MKNKKHIILTVITVAIFSFFINTNIIHAENNYKISLDFKNKVNAVILNINVNGETWNDKNDIFYSEDDIYNISITYAPPAGINPVIIYDDYWKGKIEETNFCFKGCSINLSVNNKDHRQMIEVSLVEGYTVNFETNGGSTLDSKIVEKNEKLIRPTNPTKENFIFDGWYVDEKLNDPFDFNTPITKDITLYAKWLEKTYTYEFISGNNQTFYKGKIESYILSIDGDYSLFESISIGDLNLIKDEDYDVTEGSTIITFIDKGLAKLNNLDEDEYKVAVKYTNDKEVQGKLTIINIEENPKTGDNVTLYLIIGSVSLIGLIGCSVYLNRKKLN